MVDISFFKQKIKQYEIEEIRLQNIIDNLKRENQYLRNQVKEMRNELGNKEVIEVL